MATHDCSRCLAETKQGVGTQVDLDAVAPNLVLSTSVCGAPGGGSHNWMKKTTSG